MNRKKKSESWEDGSRDRKDFWDDNLEYVEANGNSCDFVDELFLEAQDKKILTSRLPDLDELDKMGTFTRKFAPPKSTK